MWNFSTQKMWNLETEKMWNLETEKKRSDLDAALKHGFSKFVRTNAFIGYLR